MTSFSPILLLGFPRAFLAKAGDSMNVVREEEIDAVAAKVPAILAIGPLIPPRRAADLIRRLAHEPEPRPWRYLVLAAGRDLSLFQEFVADDRIYYLCADLPSEEDLFLLLSAAGKPTTFTTGTEDEYGVCNLLTHTRILSTATSANQAARNAEQALLNVLDADDAWCRLYDPDTDTLWHEERNGEQQRDSAAAGLTGFVLRTAATLRLEVVGEDPRHDPEADNPGGSPDQRALIAAIPGRAAPIGVLVAMRRASGPPFGEAEMKRIEHLSDLFGPILETWALAERSAAAPPLFRRQAMQFYESGAEEHDLLRLTPVWLRHTHILLLAVFLAALLFTSFSRIDEYASGPAVVRIGDIDFTAPTARSLGELHARIGEQAHAPEFLASCYDTEEAAELARFLDSLRNPVDAWIGDSLAALHSRWLAMDCGHEDFSLPGSHEGRITDLREPAGQSVFRDEVPRVGQRTGTSIVAFIPGRWRPQLHPGMALRLELRGYPYAYQHLRIETVSDEVLGPSEARRLLPWIAESVPLDGPVAIVRAYLPGSTFTSDENVYRFYDGMQATAEVQIRSERMLLAFVPGLKAYWTEPNSQSVP